MGAQGLSVTKQPSKLPAIIENSPIDSLKKDLVRHIQEVLTAQSLNKTKAAELAGCNRVRLTNILNGNDRGCSLDLLFEILINLDNVINVEIIPPPPTKKIRLVKRKVTT